MRKFNRIGLWVAAAVLGCGMGMAGWGAAYGDAGAATQGGAAASRPRGRNPWANMTPAQRWAHMREMEARRKKAMAGQPAAEEKIRKQVLVKALKGHQDGVLAVAFSPDGKMLASGSADRTVRLWDVASGKELKKLQGHTGGVLSVGFSSDGKYLVSGGVDRQIIAWKVATGEVEGMWTQRCPVWRLGFVPKSKFFVTLCGAHLRLWEVGKDSEVRVMKAEANFQCMAVAPDGGVVTGDRGGTVTLWDRSTGQPLLQRTRKAAAFSRENLVTSVVIAQDGNALVTDLDAVWHWDLLSGEMKLVLTGQTANALPVDDGKMLVGAYGPGVEVTGVEPRTRWQLLTMMPGQSAIQAMVHEVAVSPSGQLLAVAKGGSYGNDLHWTGAGRTDVEIYSVPELLKADRAHAAKVRTDGMDPFSHFVRGASTQPGLKLPPKLTKMVPEASQWE